MIVSQESPAIQAAIEALRQKGEAMFTNIKKEYWPLVQNIFDNLKGVLGLNVFGHEEQELSKTQLISIAKQYMPRGCNEVVVMRKAEPTGIILFISYALDRRLLEQDKNNYVIIKADKLAEEVESLFQESDLIILK